MSGVDEEVDQLDADKRDEDAADAVDEEIAAEHGRGADRPVGDAPQRQRDEGDDDERVEDDRAQDRAQRRARCMTLSGAMDGKTPTSIAGMIAKYLATSLAMLKVVRARA